MVIGGGVMVTMVDTIQNVAIMLCSAAIIITVLGKG